MHLSPTLDLSLSAAAQRASAWWLALTLKQPFGTLILDGWKDVENREWGPKALGADGAWMLLHVGASWWDVSEDLGAWCRRNLGGLPDADDRARWPRSALIGWMYVARVVDPLALGGNPWAWGPRCWVVPHVLRFPTPIPCAGARGLWPVSADPRYPAADRARFAALQAAVRATGVLPPAERAAA